MKNKKPPIKDTDFIFIYLKANPKKISKFTEAIRILNKNKILTKKNLDSIESILKYPDSEDARALAQILVLLHQANLLIDTTEPHIKCTFREKIVQLISDANDRDEPYALARSIRSLLKLGFLTPPKPRGEENMAFLLKHSEHASEVISALHSLHDKKILNPEDQKNAQYYLDTIFMAQIREQPVAALIDFLWEHHLLTPENVKLMYKNTEYAAAILAAFKSISATTYYGRTWDESQTLPGTENAAGPWVRRILENADRAHHIPAEKIKQIPYRGTRLLYGGKLLENQDIAGILDAAFRGEPASLTAQQAERIMREGIRKLETDSTEDQKRISGLRVLTKSAGHQLPRDEKVLGLIASFLDPLKAPKAKQKEIKEEQPDEQEDKSPRSSDPTSGRGAP